VEIRSTSLRWVKVPEWNQQQLNKSRFLLEDVGDTPNKLVQSRRLGIPKGRDEHLPYRFVHFDHAHQATKNPLRSHHQIVSTRP